MDNIKVVLIGASENTPAYKIAADEFIKYYKAVTGGSVIKGEKDDGKSNLVLLGNLATNKEVARLTLSGEILEQKVRTGTDDYAIKIFDNGGRKILLLQGGSARSTLYAVYSYFELLGCAWFWDGDVISALDEKSVWEKQFDLVKKERFAYRGMRYFAHRGCKRFQAETWGIDDWKREIDYLTKRKMNTFMLRIGQDDLFQKAFPEDVDYPDEESMMDLCYPNSPNYGGYDDRRLFWPLKFRGELRKKVLSYAFDRGFIHPEDCGTMTHWYSMTPRDFIKNKRPEFYNDSHYGQRDEGKVWDVSKDRNVEFYNTLTKTHIREYGRAQVFHTIGFAERTFGDDRQKNFMMKKFVYDRFLDSLARDYPNCPTFLASWDFWLSYKSEEVAKMLSTFNKDKVIMFDYTSDSPYQNNFTSWNVVNNFPYVFGMFGAYLSYNDCLGYYSLTEERMKIAKKDEYCKGMVLWPELSHSDTLMQEFFAVNAYGEEVVSVREVIKELCDKRYGEYGGEMNEIWNSALPVIELMHWTMRNDPYWNTEYYWYDLKMRYVPFVMSGKDRDKLADGLDIDAAKLALTKAVECLRKAADLIEKVNDDEFIKRDITDIARTVIGRYLNVALILQAECVYEHRLNGGEEEKIKYYSDISLDMIYSVKDVLATSSEFSLYSTLKDLEKTHPVYSGFERTLKDNTEHPYCRTSVYETVSEVLIPELKLMQSLVLGCVKSGKFGEEEIEEFNSSSELIVKAYMEKPFEMIEREKTVLPLSVAIKNCLKTVERLKFD